MPVTLALPDGYGYSVLIALGAIPTLALVQGGIVSSARKPADVKYPNAYATAEQMKNNKAAYKFNCAQRAHGNLMENMNQTIGSILFAGLFYPKASAILGAFWTVSRALYAYGYVTSDKPNGQGRMIGATFWLPQLGLTGLCIAVGLKLL